jgi:hypothetical protein
MIGRQNSAFPDHRVPSRQRRIVPLVLHYFHNLNQRTCSFGFLSGVTKLNETTPYGCRDLDAPPDCRVDSGQPDFHFVDGRRRGLLSGHKRYCQSRSHPGLEDRTTGFALAAAGVLATAPVSLHGSLKESVRCN